MANELPTSPVVTCLVGSEIDLVKLGDLLSTLDQSEHALREVDYFDLSWAHGVPKAPSRRRPASAAPYERVVAVLEDDYIGLLAG